MTTIDTLLRSGPLRRNRGTSHAAFVFGLLFWAVAIGVAVYWCVIWAQGGSDGQSGFKWDGETQVFLNLGRITALLSGYFALIEVLLLAQIGRAHV